MAHELKLLIMTFNELNISAPVLKALNDKGYATPTPIQEQAIPVASKGKDLLGIAQTGTGKTAAYILPILEKVSSMETGKTHALVVVPTRELAIQIDQQIQGFAYYTQTTSCALYGGGDGKDWNAQCHALEKGVDIIVATPGKLISFLDNDIAKLGNVSFAVLDEADRMLDIGFYEDILRIFSHVPEKRQTLMFSATMPQKIKQLAKKTLHDPKEIATAISKPAEGVIQGAYLCYNEQKIPLIQKLVLDKPECKSILIFTATKKNVSQIVHVLRLKHMNAYGISSDLEQKEREELLLKFRAKQVPILVATDVLSRGIDIKDIDVVINFDVPGDAEDYVHRVGRTARANATGVAITLINEEDTYKFYQIEQLIEKEIFKIPIPPEIGETPTFKITDQKKKQSRPFGRNKRNYSSKGRSSSNNSNHSSTYKKR